MIHEHKFANREERRRNFFPFSLPWICLDFRAKTSLPWKKKRGFAPFHEEFIRVPSPSPSPQTRMFSSFPSSLLLINPIVDTITSRSGLPRKEKVPSIHLRSSLSFSGSSTLFPESDVFDPSSMAKRDFHDQHSLLWRALFFWRIFSNLMTKPGRQKAREAKREREKMRHKEIFF